MRVSSDLRPVRIIPYFYRRSKIDLQLRLCICTEKSTHQSRYNIVDNAVRMENPSTKWQISVVHRID
jgi:hypothetical protein